MWRRVIGTGCGIVLAAGLMPPAAQATGTTGTAATAPCTVWSGSVTAAGAHTSRHASAISVTEHPMVQGVYAPEKVRLSSHFEDYPGSGGQSSVSGYVVIGDRLYRSGYAVSAGGTIVPPGPYLTRLGGGWADFGWLDWATYDRIETPQTARTEMYALRKDGVLFRWQITSKGWRSTGSYPGFSAVKTMAVISKTPTYDTFLANTRGGALYTIRIPTTVPMKPIVTRVRTRTWQGFESLIAHKCGQYGTILLGIDKQTETGHLYAVGHANGPSTVIQGLGQVDARYADQVDFRWAGVAFYDFLNGD